MHFKLIATALLLSAAFIPAAFAEDGVSDTEVTIGMVNAQSGPARALGQGMREGAQAVFLDVNDRGGIHGRRIRLVVGDDGYEPDETMSETLKMAQQHHVFALFGFVGTPTTNAALPIVREMGLPLVGAFTGAMAFREPVNPLVYNIRPSYDDETEALVAQLFAGGARRISVVHQYDAFGFAVLAGTEKALQRRGLAVTSTGSFQRNRRNIQSAVKTMVDSAPDAVVMAGPYQPLGAFVTAARSAGLASQLATVSFVGSEDLLQIVGKRGSGLLISQVLPNPAESDLAIARECRDLLQKHAQAQISFINFEGCVSARVLVMALESAGKALTRDGLRAALDAMNDANVGGLPMSLSPTNHQAMSKVYLTQISGGRIVPAPDLAPAGAMAASTAVAATR